MNEVNLEHLLTISEFSQRYPKYKESKIRWWIYRSKLTKGAASDLPANGFAQCFTRPPGERTILLIEPKVLEWLLSGQKQGGRNV
ncbi:MAG TPA: hypothetical protein VFE23_10535 [Usitatibacter sp.]|nr:hypothetical protein [Usitatibacter sp.]